MFSVGFMLLNLYEEPQFNPVFSGVHVAQSIRRTSRLSNMNPTENGVELRFFLKIEQHEPH
jgi:hypothetical protein